MGSKTRSITAIALLVFLFTICLVLAAPTWDTYHRDAVRLGVNQDPADTQNPTTIGIIWTFPRGDAAPVAEEETIVDMIPSDPTSSVLEPPNLWFVPEDLGATFPGDFYGDNRPGIQGGYYWAKAVQLGNANARARWYFPPSLSPDGLPHPFQVQVWFPSSGGGMINSAQARYSVVGSVGGTITCTVDQRDGGHWVDLRPDPFQLGPGDYVLLTNATSDADGDKVIVCADAVRFVPSTGAEIYTSPAAAEADVDGTGSPIATVWIATIESDVASRAGGVKDFGAVYAVRSYQNTLGGAFDWNDPYVTAVGTAAWRYPHGGTYDRRTPADPDTLDRLPVEGPIGRIGSVGGVFSSPTLVDVRGTLAVVFGGMDAQVYCLDATTGALIWKGPGVTISEPSSGFTDGVRTTGRYDAFGGTFLSAPVVTQNGTTIKYDIDSSASDPGGDADKTTGPGHMYAIYAWMPAVQAGDPPRTKDAAYHITYIDPTLSSTDKKRDVWVRADQSADSGLEDPNVGRWARIGGSYWNPTTVELSTESQIGDTTRVVVADAIMVVPSDIGAFSYSTAVADPRSVYIGSTSGRVYAFPLDAQYSIGQTAAQELRWTFPKVQTSNPVVDMNDGAATAFGSIVSSPAYQGGLLVVSSLNGKVYGIENLGGGESENKLLWTYDSSAGATTGPLEYEGFSSSPAIYGDRTYVPSTGGRIHEINLSTGASDWGGPYPPKDEVPLTSFRFSTPAAPPGTPTKIYCGSAGGKVYGWVDSGGSGALDAGFAQPDFWSPISSSVALDATNIFVGTLGTGDGDDGAFWWIDAATGLANSSAVWTGYTYIGKVFSSPAIANQYVYVGTGRGRLYAFSSSAFGGRWVGGGPNSNPPGRRSQAPSPLFPAPQMDVFDPRVYDETKKFVEGLASEGVAPNSDVITSLFSSVPGLNTALTFIDSNAGDDPKTWHKRAFPTPAPVGQTAPNPREVYYEWGEDIYLIAWHLPPLATISGTADTSTGVGDAGRRSNVTFYFANASAGQASGGTMNQVHPQYLIEYKLSNGELHCLALAKKELKMDSTDLPNPGASWLITVDVKTKSTDTEGKVTNSTSPRGVVPLLTGGPGSWVLQDLDNPKSQEIGFNNPLAIRDDSPNWAATALGWPNLAGGVFQTNRYDPTAHYNGNSFRQPGTQQWVTRVPRIDLGLAAHGANSRVGALPVMDRSAVGLRVTLAGGTPFRSDSIRTFRLSASDLHWAGDNAAIQTSGGVMLPWEYPPWWPQLAGPGVYRSRLQRDYPDVSRREENFQKIPDNSDPSVGNTVLQPALPKDPADPNDKDYNTAQLTADLVNTWVQVPQYQPANLSRPGYGTVVTAWIDSNRNGRFDEGDPTTDRPGTHIDPYHKFELWLDVPPDRHMVVERPLTIEVLGPDSAPAPHGLGFGLLPADMAPWFKQFVVRNLGNVNLTDIEIAKRFSSGVAQWPLSLPGDSISAFFPLAGSNVRSSFDGWDPIWGDISLEPFTNTGFGYTLSKSRVGEVTPMELTIPDARKCQEWPTITMPEILKKDPTWKGNFGILPSVSAVVPLTQPTGRYHQFVPVFADMAVDGTKDVLDLGKEAFSDPSFTLIVKVAEDRLTGGPTAGSAVQIDQDQPLGQERVVFGDVQPTAWRDPATGDAHLFWSSNRFISSGSPLPSSPWYIAHASLHYDKPQNGPPGEYNWKFSPTPPTPLQWWETPDPSSAGFKLPGFPWPGASPLPPDYQVDSVKHSSPWAAVDADLAKVWLFWQGQIDKKDPVTTKLERESRIFYTIATGGVVSGDQNAVYSFPSDLSLMKMNPKAVAYASGTNENIWLTWNGGDVGQWSIFGNLNTSPADQHDPNAWSADVRFQTPSCLVSVAEPSPVHRVIGSSDAYMDIAYSGRSKYDQTTDIFLTRYRRSGSWQNPRVDAVRMPRVRFNELLPRPMDPANDPEMPWRNAEELLRDSKRNVYTSKHVAWIRPPTAGRIDQWETPADPTAYTDYPFIRVRLPDGTVVSGTDGRVIDPTGTEVAPPAAIAPEIDRATGVYTYTYTDALGHDTQAATLIGQMLVDFSAGMVRFTNPLPPKTKAYAQYTPQARRLTRGPEQDSAPFMFMEKTPMSSQANSSGLCPNPGLVLPDPTYTGQTSTDRLWLFWRKPTSSGVLASTTYYRTYRITATLARPVDMGKDAYGRSTGRPSKDVTLAGAAGPCEVSWDGSKLYFTEPDERYPGMSGYPGPVQVTYKPSDAATPNQTITVDLDTLSWEEELPETALPTRQIVNEGQVSAFADPSVVPTKIWVFWSSTRAGESDLYYQTISPNFQGAP